MKSSHNLRFHLLDPGLMVAEYSGHRENNTVVFQSHKYHNYKENSKQINGTFQQYSKKYISLVFGVRTCFVSHGL